MKQIKFLTPVILSLILVVSFASCDKYSKVKAEIQIFQDSLSNPDWYKKTILTANNDILMDTIKLGKALNMDNEQVDAVIIEEKCDHDYFHKYKEDTKDFQYLLLLQTLRKEKCYKKLVASCVEENIGIQVNKRCVSDGDSITYYVSPSELSDINEVTLEQFVIYLREYFKNEAEPGEEPITIYNYQKEISFFEVIPEKTFNEIKDICENKVPDASIDDLRDLFLDIICDKMIGHHHYLEIISDAKRGIKMTCVNQAHRKQTYDLEISNKYIKEYIKIIEEEQKATGGL